MVRAGKGSKMTILEKFKADHPGMPTEFTVKAFCPEDFGYNRPNAVCCMTSSMKLSDCEKCWAQEYREEGGTGGD